jgi:hypothetical protein
MVLSFFLFVWVEASGRFSITVYLKSEFVLRYELLVMVNLINGIEG